MKLPRHLRKRANSYIRKSCSPLPAKSCRNRRFLTPLIEHFGMRRMVGITDLDVTNFAQLVYPNATPQTINRQVYTPLIAVWRVAPACAARTSSPAQTSRKAR